MKKVKPFVKWAGGKRQILDRIDEFIQASLENTDENYKFIEPFLGGGAVFFNLRPKRAVINDLNKDLMNAYKVIKSDEYEKLIELLAKHEEEYHKDKEEYYYEVRSQDRTEKWPHGYTNVQRAARMIFLNKTCYNGLYRVNSRGEFNTPIGRYTNPLINDEDNIRAIHNYFNEEGNEIVILDRSYEFAMDRAEAGDIIYLDPPYDYEDDDGFTQYTIDGFSFEDFKKLKKKCDEVIDKGAFVILSNNATDKVLKLFEENPGRYQLFYDETKFKTLRTINSKGNERRTGYEVIIWGFQDGVPFPQANDMNKVIALLKAEEECLTDKKMAKNLIKVESTRQVAYYLSALMFLNYITRDKKFTVEANKVRFDDEKLRKDIFDKLYKDKVFNLAFQDALEGKGSLIKIQEYMKDKYRKMSESTIIRRSNTVKSWVGWMIEHTEKTI